MDWALIRMCWRMLRFEIAGLYARHRLRLRVALVVLLLCHPRSILRGLLTRALRRLHRLAAAERPQLVYEASDINRRLLQQCPTMTHGSYCPPWFLFNGHLQTLRLAQTPPTAGPRVLYERQILSMPDGGIVSLDWALPPRPDGTIPRVADLPVAGVAPSKPTMLVLPGLTGGSDEFYIRALVAAMLARDWHVLVLNARGCAETPVKSPQLFCCGYTDDLRFVLEHLHATYGFAVLSSSSSLSTPPLVAVGFSMGSNVLVKYLGETRERALVTAGVSVGNPFDLVQCSRRLRETWLYRQTYDRALLQNLQELVFARSNAHEVLGDHPALDLDHVRAARSVCDFDERLTRVLFGYDSAWHYYEDASSRPYVADVRVPLLCLNARDDPISPAEAIPFAEAAANPRVILCVTRRGGHLAFFEQQPEGVEEETRAPPSVWSVRAIAEFAEGVRVVGASSVTAETVGIKRRGGVDGFDRDAELEATSSDDGEGRTSVSG